MDPLELTKKLISFKSVTPKDDGSLDFIKDILDSMGFFSKVIEFTEEGTPSVKNLYAKIGNGSKTFCFAGHIDVVPEGDLKAWNTNPFVATVKGNMLYGRGAVDMKSGVACFISAIKHFIKHDFNKEQDSILVLITAGEEGAYVNGTYKLIRHVVNEENIKIDTTLLAEPSSKDKLGDTIKVGRRGSMNFTLVAKGKQGHVAYQKMANNPMYCLIPLLNELVSLQLDNGNEYFEPSNLEVVSLASSSNVYNIIPESAEAKINIRFNNEHSEKSLTALIETIVNKYENVDIKHNLPHVEPFLVDDSSFLQQISNSITSVTGIKPVFSTGGGVSDAAYIKDFSKVLEFGLPNKTLHEANEQANIKDIYLLADIYHKVLQDFFKK